VNPTPEDTTGALRRVAGRVLILVATRLELLAFEFTEERRSVVELLILAVAGAVLGLLAVVVLTAAGILAFPPPWRPLAALIVGLLYAGGSAALLVRARRKMRERAVPFAATIAELKRDREWLGTLK
jgi:uncharacterized membrane protein YqjE